VRCFYKDKKIINQILDCNKKNPQSFHLWIFHFKLNFYIYLTGVVVAESILVLTVSGVVVVVVVVSNVVGDTLCVVLSTAVESVLLLDIEDSLVPQLTVNIPKPTAINKNFLIIILFWCLKIKSIIIPNKVNNY
jgi:hypothetical protein